VPIIAAVKLLANMASNAETAQNVMVVLTAVPGEGVGRAIGRQLVEERIAACVSVLKNHTSIYRWEGRVCEDAGELLVIKTSGGTLSALIERLGALHPDTLPEIIALPVEQGLPAYLEWVANEVVTPPGAPGGDVGQR